MATIAAVLWFQGQRDDATSTFLVALIVGAIGAASVIYDLDHWHIAKRIALHFLAMLITVYPVLVLSGWFPNQTVADWLIIFGVFIATGVVILSTIGLGIALYRLARKPAKRPEPSSPER